jgi:hypothetical protein
MEKEGVKGERQWRGCSAQESESEGSKSCGSFTVWGTEDGSSEASPARTWKRCFEQDSMRIRESWALRTGSLAESRREDESEPFSSRARLCPHRKLRSKGGIDEGQSRKADEETKRCRNLRASFQAGSS